MITVTLAAMAGATVAACVIALMRSADDPQVPFLLPGKWRVEIDPTGDCVSHERVIDFDAGVRRLLDEG